MSARGSFPICTAPKPPDLEESADGAVFRRWNRESGLFALWDSDFKFVAIALKHPRERDLFCVVDLAPIRMTDGNGVSNRVHKGQPVEVVVESLGLLDTEAVKSVYTVPNNIGETLRGE